MADNRTIIEVLQKCFEEDQYEKFTNCALVFAYNGTGKTRLSYDFAHYGRTEGSPHNTLYYNAYTEDLFTWDNDLENNSEYRLLINQNSGMIQGLAGYDISESLHKYLSVFTDIDFNIQQTDNIPEYVVFSKKEGERLYENIKISRGEERLFVWCFFRCILDLVVNGNDAYRDIEYIYIDDPMSSLDDNNVIAFAAQLYNVIRDQFKSELDASRVNDEFRRIKFVVSTHHALFFHVMLHGLKADKKLGRYYLSRNKQNDELVLKSMSNDTPFYYNVAVMAEIKKAIDNDKLYAYHFNVLRSVMEKIKEFFGHSDYKHILDGIEYKGYVFVESASDNEEVAELYSRIVNVFSHQASFFAPLEMTNDSKELATSIFNHLVQKYQFELPDLTNFHSEAWISNHS